MSQPVVLVDRDRRGVATVTLNRPEVNNAYDGEMIDTLAQIFSDLAGDDGLRVVIIRGNGRHFQAGADLDWIRAVSQRGASENRVVSERTAKLMRDLDAFSRPTVAIVHGGCFGGGTGLVASCDIVVAASGSMFSIAEARWGLTAAIIVPQLNAAMGARNLRRYALSCERFDAYQAQAMGLVHEVCEMDQLGETAAGVVDALLMSAPEAVAATKRTVRESVGLIQDDEVFAALVDEHAAIRQSAEAREGLASFTERRKPRWYPG